MFGISKATLQTYTKYFVMELPITKFTNYAFFLGKQNYKRIKIYGWFAKERRRIGPKAKIETKTYKYLYSLGYRHNMKKL